jgi:uncharacterized protein (TIGR02246 family)
MRRADRAPRSVRIGHMVARHVPKLVAVAIGLIAIACAGRDARSPNPGADERVFASVMDRIAKGWNTGDAAGAADCFTEDAVYMEPPDRQKYVGRSALFEFFGGRERPPPEMKMTWHHLAFDRATQTGFGEYTFEGNRRYHGIVVVRLKDGKIRRWREYQQTSTLSWEEFAGASAF